MVLLDTSVTASKNKQREPQRPGCVHEVINGSSAFGALILQQRTYRQSSYCASTQLNMHYRAAGPDFHIRNARIPMPVKLG